MAETGHAYRLPESWMTWMLRRWCAGRERKDNREAFFLPPELSCLNLDAYSVLVALVHLGVPAAAGRSVRLRSMRLALRPSTSCRSQI